MARITAGVGSSHVPLLGAATAAILIWSQHFADTLTRRRAPGGRAGLGIRLGLHTVGAGIVVAGMLTASVPVVIAGAAIVAAAIAGHAVVLGLQLRAALPSRKRGRPAPTPMKTAL